MVVNESALLRAMREDYKGQGYTVARRAEIEADPESESILLLSANDWMVEIGWKNVSDKIFGLVAEHMKGLPEVGQACRENSAKYPFRVYLYESKSAGGLGAITGYFECGSYAGTSGIYLEEIARRALVSMEYLTDYGKGGWVYGWEVKNPCRFPAPLPISDLGFQRPPQSWCYLDAKACEILEVAAHGPSKA